MTYGRLTYIIAILTKEFRSQLGTLKTYCVKAWILPSILPYSNEKTQGIEKDTQGKRGRNILNIFLNQFFTVTEDTRIFAVSC